MSYVFSSSKLEKREEHVLPGSEGIERGGRWVGGQWGVGPNNVYT
jgi:hypothetical protein